MTQQKNKVVVVVGTESGCNPSEGEYLLHIVSFDNALDICSPGGVDDVSLIQECIENDLDFSTLQEEGETEVTLLESGEWEDVFWHKYYLIKEVKRIEL